MIYLIWILVTRLLYIYVKIHALNFQWKESIFCFAYRASTRHQYCFEFTNGYYLYLFWALEFAVSWQKALHGLSLLQNWFSFVDGIAAHGNTLVYCLFEKRTLDGLFCEFGNNQSWMLILFWFSGNQNLKSDKVVLQAWSYLFPFDFLGN